MSEEGGGAGGGSQGSPTRAKDSAPKARLRAFPMNDDHVEAKLAVLTKAIQDILIQGNHGLIFEELYRDAYTIVLYKHGEILYNGLKEIVTQHLKLKVRPKVLENKHNNFLNALSEAWTGHLRSMVWIRDILMYMDRVYVPSSGVDNVYNLGVNTFKREIVLHKELKDHLRLVLVDVITREREGDLVDRIMIKKTCQMLVDLGIDDRSVYESIFERPFLKQSEIFYQLESQKLTALNHVSDYVKLVETRLIEESDRAKNYLDPATEPKITEIVENELVKKNVRTLIDDTECEGVACMLDHEKVEDLAAVYKLLSRVVDGLEILGNRVSRYIREEGKVITEDKNPISFVQRLLSLKLKMDNFLQVSFNQDRIFQQMIADDFRYCLNLNSKSPEYLSLFVDDKLKKEVKGVSDEDVEHVLDKTMSLVRLLLDRDMFESYYKKHLSGRLVSLLHKSLTIETQGNIDADLDVISSGIAKLKAEFGCHQLTKLEGMFKDLTMFSGINQNFQAFVAENHVNLQKTQLTVRVLTTVFWPLHEIKLSPKIPPVALSAFQEFQKFYLTKHTGRKLMLCSQFGSADLSATFPFRHKNEVYSHSATNSPCKLDYGRSFSGLRRYTIQVSTYQMCILMLFNEREEMTFSELSDATEIPENDLISALQTLAMGKLSHRILSKVPNTPKSKIINPTDLFKINNLFTSKVERVKIFQFSNLKEDMKDFKHIEGMADIFMSRNSEVEATIKRILKVRKTLSHDNLIIEVKEQLKARFVPSPDMLSSNITKLIEKESLAVSENGDHLKVYTYIPFKQS